MYVYVRDMIMRAAGSAQTDCTCYYSDHHKRQGERISSVQVQEREKAHAEKARRGLVYTCLCFALSTERGLLRGCFGRKQHRPKNRIVSKGSHHSTTFTTLTLPRSHARWSAKPKRPLDHKDPPPAAAAAAAAGPSILLSASCTPSVLHSLYTRSLFRRCRRRRPRHNPN